MEGVKIVPATLGTNAYIGLNMLRLKYIREIAV